ncbi:LOW QUALITY PROTEIN: PIN2/TERF1-interacting telomerase inhibitor 1-like [Panulirus ornatus]|uniref:LOW QUALITY PROTEIN: PIN2/TERF1-interacting telomerase inhibitor 1-like n=1 Tax=Panulirus ornatus TaxID=150431 RepID=UPI003A8932B2
MPILAEPRRRQIWTLNPRGANWANDDSTFGQKLMEKLMGWSKGKGRGRNEQGMKKIISLSLKDNKNGIVYIGNDDEWFRHYEGFEDVLATLNSEHNSTANSKNGSSCNSSANSDEDINQMNKRSLEARSKVSKARVQYHKFTCGKDLSRYNKDDIACILGSKRTKKLAEADAEVSTTKIDEIGHVTSMNNVTTIKGCSIQDYFKQKMAALKGSTLPELQKAENREEGKKELLKPGFGSSLDISCSNVSLINGEAGEKKPEKDDTEERSSKFTK